MEPYDFSAPRLYIDANLAAGHLVEIDKAQQNYLCNVLRLSEGKTILVFNGHDGEWRATLAGTGRRTVALRLDGRLRAQTIPGDLHYAFAPLKHARLDYMVQKAVEMGATRLQPVMTRRTQAARVNLERMRANAIEAAEQCGILDLPDLSAPLPFSTWLADHDDTRAIVFCDEEAPTDNALATLRPIAASGRAMTVLIGPEGGFDATERAALLSLPRTARISLGPRILRADTAAVAALALVQAAVADATAVGVRVP